MIKRLILVQLSILQVWTILDKILISKDASWIKLNKMLSFFVLVIKFFVALGTTNIYHYNFTFNPIVNNVTLDIDTFKHGSFNFSYDLNIWNHMDIYNETSKIFKKKMIK